MFKRVERRIRKKEQEEKLGLDEETKEMLGLNAADTDSDESDSSSGSESNSEDHEQEQGLGEDEDEDEDENANDAEEDVMGQDEEDEEDSEAGSNDDEEDGDEAPMSVSEALKNPLWHVSLEPEVKACAACPGKLLKNPVMIEVHMKSGAHKRRFAKLREAAMNVDPETDVRDLMRAQRLASQPEKPAQDRLSKRAEKKKAKLAAIKAKRTKQKVMKAKYRAKKEAKEKAVAESDATTSGSEDGTNLSPAKPPAAKKRKVGRDLEDERSASKTVASPAKQKLLKAKAGSKLSKAMPSSPKPSKPLKKSNTGTPSKRSEKPTAKSQQKLVAKPITSPLETAVSRDAKTMKKRKRSDIAS
ncbi:hypothetical protein V8D89_007769 [Ganoderma adspersum]